MITLGEKAKDNITGFSGIVIARIEYLNGCVQYQLQPEKMSDGKMADAVWFDVQRLEKNSPVKVGGPTPGEKMPAFNRP